MMCAAFANQTALVRSENGVTILGYRNWPSRIAVASSSLYARNLLTFLTSFWDKEAKAPKLPAEDDIVKGVLLTRAGAIDWNALGDALEDAGVKTAAWTVLPLDLGLPERMIDTFRQVSLTRRVPPRLLGAGAHAGHRLAAAVLLEAGRRGHVADDIDLGMAGDVQVLVDDDAARAVQRHVERARQRRGGHARRPDLGLGGDALGPAVGRLQVHALLVDADDAASGAHLHAQLLQLHLRQRLEAGGDHDERVESRAHGRNDNRRFGEAPASSAGGPSLRSRCQPAAAIMAALSVQNSGRG